MAIPTFQEIMLPVLQHFSDKKEHTLTETVSYVEDLFKLTSEEREQLLPSGYKRIIYHRTAWAITYMRSALLVQIIKRGCYKITQRGIDFLSTKPIEVNTKILMEKFPEFNDFFKKTKSKDQYTAQDVVTLQEAAQSPEEIVDANYETIKTKLCDELLDLILNNSPAYFEKLVIDLLVNMGYGGSRSEAGKAVGKSGDEGIDGVINEDRLGLDMIYVQAKRWNNSLTTVGRPEIQKFVGALAGKQASKGIFITTSSFSPEARSYVKNLQQKVILIDGFELASYMVEYNVGVGIYNTYVIKKIDYDYFEEN